jgi:WD40 repeat protein
LRVLPNFSVIRRHHVAIGTNVGHFKRVLSWTALSLIAALLSCSRPPRSSSQLASTSTNGSATQNAPQQALPAPQARAVIVVDRGAAAEQPDLSGAQRPDRMFASGHTSAVTAVALSQDHRWAATGGDDKTIRIWDIATGREERVLIGPTDRVTSLVFSRDGQRLASTSADGTARVWDPATAASIYTFNLGSGWAQQATFSADGKLLAVSAGAADEGAGSIIEIHNAATGAKIRSVALDWNSAVPLTITSDGRLLSSGGAGEDGEYVSTKTWDLQSGRELKSLPVAVTAFSADGRWGASLEYQQGAHINLWDITSGQRVRKISLPLVNVSGISFTPDGSCIVGYGSEIKFFEASSGKEVRTLPIPAGVLAFSGDGKWLAASSGSSVKIWDLDAGRELQNLAGQLGAQDLTFSPDSKFLVTGDAALGIWEVSSGRLTRTIPGGTQNLVYSSDGLWLATNPKGQLKVWDTTTWTPGTLSPSTGEHVWWMGFARAQLPPGDLAATEVKWWQVGTGPEARFLWGATYAAAFSPDGKFLVTAARSGGNVSVWDGSSGQLLQTFVAHDVGVSVVAFSPDGRWLLTTGQDSRIDPGNFAASMANLKHSIKLWEIGTWRQGLSLQFTGMTGGFRGFSPNGQTLAVITGNLISLYSLPEGKVVRTLTGGGNGTLRFSPDGMWLAQSGPNGIALWNLSSPAK